MAEEVFLKASEDFSAKWIRRAQGRALVVGSKCYDDKVDRRGLYSNAVGIDLEDGTGVDFVHDLEKPLPASVGKFSHIDCCSVLEHVRRPWLMAENILSVMEPEATILVTVPFVWRQHAYPSDYWRISAEGLDVLFPAIVWEKKKYAVGDKLRNKVPGKANEFGVWMARAEVVAFGALCK